jgi:hypothetical protein
MAARLGRRGEPSDLAGVASRTVALVLVCGLLTTAGCNAATSSPAHVFEYGKDLTPQPAPTGGTSAREITLAADRAVTVQPEAVALSLTFTNSADHAADIFFFRYPHHPLQQALTLTLRGEGVVQVRDPQGPEVYDAFAGAKVYEKVTLPAGSVMKMHGVLPLTFYEYRGTPTAKLAWSIATDLTPPEGSLDVVLPASRSLPVAAANGWRDDVISLLADGVDVNAKDSYGSTAITLAADRGQTEVVAILLAHHAELGQSLLAAINSDHVDVVRLLVASGASVRETFDEQKTPLHWAATNHRTEIARFLIEKGADVSALDKWGHTPLSLAAGQPPELVALLQQGASR